ncbi:MAG: hypothetical protein U5N58_10435 [Actinomycetota bacterium]|nr:hypothetical protein [Actinomycetota bacterium]
MYIWVYYVAMGISPVTIKLMHLLYVQGINSAFFNKVFRQYGRDMSRVFSYFGIDRKMDRCSRLDRIIYQLKQDNPKVLNLTDKQYPELLI